MVSNTIGAIKILKKLLAKEYKMKDLRKVRTIIGWQIIKDTIVCIMKINLSAFLKDLVIKIGYTQYNANIIPIEA